MAISLTARMGRKSKYQMAEQSQARHKQYWPEVPDEEIWTRQKQDGFITIPRTMSIVMAIIDSFTKGKPAGMTYFTLWCRCPDYAAIEIDSPAAFATETGFGGQRHVAQWKARMKDLEKLGFIKAKHSIAGDFHDVLLINPHKVIQQMKDVPESLRRQLFSRGQQIRAKDITDPVVPPKLPVVVATKTTAKPRVRRKLLNA